MNEKYVVSINWGLGGPLGCQPHVYISTPEWAETNDGGDRRDLHARIAEVARWGRHEAEVWAGNTEGFVVAKVGALHVDRDKPPRYIAELIKRLRRDVDDIPRDAEYRVAKFPERR